MVVPSARGVCTRTTNRSRRGTGGLRLKAAKRTRPPTRAPPSTDETKVRRESSTSSTTTFSAGASPLAVTDSVKVTVSPGSSAPLLSSTKVLVTASSAWLTMGKRVGSKAAAVLGSSERTVVPGNDGVVTLAWFATRVPLLITASRRASKLRVTVAPMAMESRAGTVASSKMTDPPAMRPPLLRMGTSKFGSSRSLTTTSRATPSPLLVTAMV